MTRADQTKLEMERGACVIRRAQRESRMDQWDKEGRIKIRPFLQFSINGDKPRLLGHGPLTGRDPTHTTVQVGDIFFNEPAGDYPSEVLFAKVALAVQAGVDASPGLAGVYNKYEYGTR